ncbi:MAG: SDR family oxidoreductase [Ignavibacteria bacterium]|nr:SDR family oxidoreductase [Ignavibacteria bacterium]
MKKILIIGACSAIAQETAKLFAKDGHQLFLADINNTGLEIVKKELLLMGETEIFTSFFDVTEFSKHSQLIENAISSLNGLDLLFIAHGTLPNQEEVQKDASRAIKEFEINAMSVISLCTIAANYFEEKKDGAIAVISSVAGDRGRQSNYLYGSAKGAVSLFLQGLRNRLSKSNVHILTIKPGLVDSPMTAHLPKNFLFAKPSDIAKGIYKAIEGRKDIVYLPSYWWLILTTLKLIPESIFKKMNL